MRWQLEDGFGIDHLNLRDDVVDEPGPGEVVLRMKALSLNYRDLLMVRGHYNPRQPLPLVPCSDGVGVVEAVGDGVDTALLGQRRCPIFAQAWHDGEPTPAALASTLGGPLHGTARGFMTLPLANTVVPPAHLDDAQATSLPCAGVTAWSALFRQGGLRAGDRVLVLGTGGVSTFALQLAVAAGCEVTVTSSSDDKLERARQMGAHHTLNYKEQPDWGKVVAKQGGVHLVLEVGGAGTFEQSLRAVRPGGIVSLIGVLSGVKAPVALTRILMTNVRVQGVFVGHRSDFEALNRALALHHIAPLVDRVFPWESLPDAMHHLASGRHQGKVVVSRP